MRKLIIAFFTLIFSFSLCFGSTFDNMIEALKKGEIEKAYYYQKRLPESEKKLLEILILLHQNRLLDAEFLSGKYVPCNVLYLPAGTYALVVDKVNEILYVLKEQEGIPVIVTRFNCITGKKPGDKLKEGDQRTPEGIYIPLYWRTHLPKIYGPGAYVLNYPNLIDRKILHRGGHGIWIHGMDTPSRPPHSTNGCIVLENKNLRKLRKYIKPKETPVIIVDELCKEPLKTFISERNSLVDFVYKWKTAWENSPKNLQKYFSFYSRHFVTDKYNFNEWKKYKEKVTSHKKWVKIKVSNLTISRDGRLLSFGRLYLISFDMKYRSNNYNWQGHKLLYVTKEGDKWKILGEESF
ncbi:MULTISPECIES: L,D-transpeptidase family protein [unclassified Desulfurobacterium]|uniref:L,D-transpeptidase family protein n=1 Tax=Desulfurobacterium sp. TC5-1 TaxID=1158318 RepID=UPI0003B715D4|nr:L,D-transpeptidase family protein [Desulfurobacterium sp. TC5-1]